MPDPTLIQQLARFAAATKLSTLPTEVAASVPQRVLDVLGICVRATTLDTSTAVLDWAEEEGGVPRATAVGLADRLPASRAAFVNGVLAHSLDYDDTHLPSVLHPSASVVPAALAAAEASGASGAETVAAVAVGVEICVRLGMAGYDEAAGQSVFFEHGQHATSICGAIGSAAAAAMLQRPGPDTDRIANAMGIAASMASGIIEANRTGGTVKRIHCGWAAQAGVTAAGLARRGLTGAPTALEGRFGFFQAFLRDQWSPEPVTDGLGEMWSVPGVFYKPYPANHFTHAGIDAALKLRAAGLRVDEIESIHLGVATPTVRTIGEPIEAKRTPETGYQAQFSGPFTIAAALCRGSGLGLGLADFTDEAARDPELRSLMAKISVAGDPDCDAIYPHQFPAVLTVTTTDGRTLVERVLANRGGGQWPLSSDELAAKFADNVEGLLEPADAKTVVERCGRLAELHHLDELMAPLRLDG